MASFRAPGALSYWLPWTAPTAAPAAAPFGWPAASTVLPLAAPAIARIRIATRLPALRPARLGCALLWRLRPRAFGLRARLGRLGTLRLRSRRLDAFRLRLRARLRLRWLLARTLRAARRAIRCRAVRPFHLRTVRLHLRTRRLHLRTGLGAVGRLRALRLARRRRDRTVGATIAAVRAQLTGNQAE